MSLHLPIRRSISLRLVAATLLVSLLVSLVVTAGQLRITYRNKLTTAGQRLDEVGNSIVPSLSSSLWLVDKERVDLLLDGLARLPGIAYVRLNSEGQVFERGDPKATPLLRHSYFLHYDNGGHFDLGTLQVVVGNKLIFEQLRNAAFTIALTTLVTLLASSLLLLLLFRVWVTRHLEAMAEYASHLSIERLQVPMLLGRRRRELPDELDKVVLAFNRMREHMIDELAVRAEHERELLMHRERLESLVRSRTAELEKQTQEMQRLANTDSLTGVCSRRCFLEQVESEIVRSRRLARPLAVMMLDIDHFKQINDGYGHAVGDQALIALARACTLQLREIDVIGRLGGEEFAILLPETDLQHAGNVAERLRSAVAELKLSIDDGQVVAFTISIGLCALSQSAEDVDALLGRADRELYRAKRSGRNRVCAEGDVA